MLLRNVEKGSDVYYDADLVTETVQLAGTLIIY